MSVELLRNVRDGRTYARFVVEGHWDDREVSVLGPFNDWTPGVDVLLPDRNGTRSALVEVDEGPDVQFRYLATGNDWFDDPDVDEYSERGGTVHWPTAATAPEGGPAVKKAPAAKEAPAAKKAAAKKTTAVPAKKAAAKRAAPAKKAPPAPEG